MNHIRVISPGLQTTVQDLGRFGYAHFGAGDPLDEGDHGAPILAFVCVTP